MALFNMVTGLDVKQTASGVANEIERNMARWKYFADKLGTMTDQDFTDLGITGDYRTYLGSLRVSILNLELKYRNQAPLDPSDPSYFVKLFSQLLVM